MKTFKTKRQFPFSPAQLFSALRDPAILATWWGPAGFTNTFHQFEFENGGKWAFIMHGPDGGNYPNEAVFQEVIMDEKVVIRHSNEPHFTLTITLSASDEGSLVEWNQEFDSEEVAKKVEHIVVPSNEQNLDRWMAALSN